jgi:oxalate decarboxylase/phosphoglucose isomerase-like protein (cupin superfamily)
MTSKTQRPEADATIHVDNDRVRVTEYRFSPGAETTWHQHQWDYVVVPQTDGQLLLVGPGGEESHAALRRSVPYYREAGVEHNVINAGDQELIFIEIEMKAHPIAGQKGA